MTFGSALRFLTAALSVCAVSLFAGEASAQPETETPGSEMKAGAPDTAELLANIANFKTLRTKFVQTKHLKAFKKPMVLNGELCLDRPGKRFAWHVEKPLQYSCIIANGKLTQWDADSDKTVSVPFSKYPMLEMLSDAMTAFASGDVKALEKDFEAAAGKDGTTELKEMAKTAFLCPDCPETIAPIALATALQLLAYQVSLARGCDVDQPRNLAKSVTVE